MFLKKCYEQATAIEFIKKKKAFKSKIVYINLQRALIRFIVYLCPIITFIRIGIYKIKEYLCLF